MGIGLPFCHVESLHFENVLSMPLAVHLYKEIAVPGLFDISQG